MSLNPSPSSSNKHEKWIEQFGISYKDAADNEKRLQIFKNNVEFIELFHVSGDKPFNLSIKHFAHLTNDWTYITVLKIWNNLIPPKILKNQK